MTTSRDLEQLYRDWSPKSAALIEEAKRVLPGGDTRASAHYLPYPLAMERGEGARIYDIEGRAFLDYCKALFKEQVHARQHEAHIVKARVAAIDSIVKKVGTGGDKISATDAATLLLALEQSSTLTPGAAFLPRSFEAEADGKITVDVKQMLEVLTDDQLKALGVKK